MPATTITRRQFKSRMATKQDVWRAIPALMGNGNGTIQVPNQENMVYIRVGDGDLGQAFNNRCPLRDNLAIYVGYDPITDPDRRIFQVLSVRMADYASAGNVTVPNVGPHNTTHYYGGGDDVYIEWRRLMGLRVGRPVAFVVTVDPGIFYTAGAWTEIPATTVNLTATHAALVGVQAQYVLISLSSAGVVTSTVGTAVASIALLTISDCPSPPAGHIPLAAVRLYKLQTAIDDVPAAPDIVDLRFPTFNTLSGYVTPHNILSASHGDSLLGAVSDGDTIIGNVTPKWSRLAISVPAANVRNALGIDNGELRPSWKTTLDATNPTTIGIGDAASPGTSLIYSHRDHQHASPATWTATAHAIDGATHTVAGRTTGQVLIATGAAAFGWSSGTITFGGSSSKLIMADTTFSLLGGGVSSALSLPDAQITLNGGGASCSLQLPNDKIVLAGGGASSVLTLPNAATTITGGGTIALGTYTLTVPATGTAALLGTANVFTASQTINGTALRIMGDFSNATHASRLLFQSSTTNGNTLVGALPNGTGTTSAFNIYDNSDLTAALAFGQFRVVAATAIDFNSNVLNAGTQLPLTFSIASTAKMTIGTSGGVQIGAPTGGDKGTGTVNAAADIYKNNSAYTNPDYALEQWATGSIVKFADRPGAKDYRRMTLGEIEAHINEHLRLPRMSDEPSGIFERADMVLEKLEELYTHVIELGHRLQEFEVARG